MAVADVSLARRLARLAHAQADGSGADLSRALDDAKLFRAGKISAKEFLDAIRPLASSLARVIPDFADEDEAVQAVRVLLLATSGRELRFRSALLEEGYTQYARLKEKGKASAKSRLEWAAKQRGKSRYLVELRRLLGEQHKTLLARPAPRTRIAYLPNAAVSIYRTYHHKILPYGKFAKVPKYGMLQADHLAESRFLRMVGIGNIEDMPALLVPTDLFSAGLFRSIGITPPYPHRIKTNLMEELVPWRSEHTYSSQQIFDAHAAVFLRLKLDQELWESQLITVMEEIAQLHDGMTLDVSLSRITPEMFRGWHPEYVK